MSCRPCQFLNALAFKCKYDSALSLINPTLQSQDVPLNLIACFMLIVCFTLSVYCPERLEYGFWKECLLKTITYYNIAGHLDIFSNFHYYTISDSLSLHYVIVLTFFNKGTTCSLSPEKHDDIMGFSFQGDLLQDLWRADTSTPCLSLFIFYPFMIISILIISINFSVI